MPDLNRREAFKALAAVAGAAGLTVTPVTTQDAQGVELVVLKCPGPISAVTAERLKVALVDTFKGTSLEHARAVVLGDGIDIEFVRTKGL